MKNKKLTYILLPLAALLWGIIIYKIVSYKTDEPEIYYSGDTKEKQTEKTNEPDTFSLYANYKDPFLYKIPSYKPYKHKKTNNKNIRKNRQIKRNIEKKVIKWPKIVYGGMIKNQPSDRIIVIVKVNNSEKLMREGEIVDSVQLLKVYRDSIRVKLNNEIKTIVK